MRAPTEQVAPMTDHKVNQSARAPMGAFSLLRRACAPSATPCTNDLVHLVHLVLALGVLTSAVACSSRSGSESGSGATPSSNPSDTTPLEGGQSGIGGSATELGVTSGGSAARLQVTRTQIILFRRTSNVGGAFHWYASRNLSSTPL
jgi:hypothetical protein